MRACHGPGETGLRRVGVEASPEVGIEGEDAETSIAGLEVLGLQDADFGLVVEFEGEEGGEEGRFRD